VKQIADDAAEEKVPAPKEPPALDPPEASRTERITHVEQRSGPPLIRWIVAAAIVLILAFLILLLARWVYHKSHHRIQPAPATSQQSPKTSSTNTQAGQNQQNNGASSKNSSNTSNSTNNSTATLPNNGPGNVAGIFVISTAAAAGLHYAVRSRRVNN